MAIKRRLFNGIRLFLLASSFACAAPLASRAQYIHDTMLPGEHPDFGWHANLVAWGLHDDGVLTGLPDIGWRSGVVSDIRFDPRRETFSMVARIDRNPSARYVIGFTDLPVWMADYRYINITLGICVDASGALSPSWDPWNASIWQSVLGEGIYDVRIAVDRTEGEVMFDIEEAPSFDAPLSTFSAPAWSAAEPRELAEIYHIQINPYEHYSAVYDAWSDPGSPQLLNIPAIRPFYVDEGDTIAVPLQAEYDGEGELRWSFGDGRFEREGSLFTWATRDGHGGAYSSFLRVDDGYLADSALVEYSVLQVYDSSLVHDRMYVVSDTAYDWASFDDVAWMTWDDGFMLGPDHSWTSGAVSREAAWLHGVRTFVFRLESAPGMEYFFGLTGTPADESDCHISRVDLGLEIDMEGDLKPSWYTGSQSFEGTRLEDGLHDIAMTWDPASGQVTFAASPVSSWVDSISDFSGAVWTERIYADIASPAWIQINPSRGGGKVYDVWSYSAPEPASAMVLEHSAEGFAGGVRIEWTLSEPAGTGRFVVMRCDPELLDCFEPGFIPAATGATKYWWADDGLTPGSSFTYRVYFEDQTGSYLMFDTGEVEVPEAPAALLQNFPNPFNPSTTIRWYLPETRRATVEIYDVAGRHVSTVFDGRSGAGFNAAEWDGTDLEGEKVSSGVYFYRIRAGDFERAMKMVVIR